LALCLIGGILLALRVIFGAGPFPGGRSQNEALRFIAGILVPATLLIFGLTGLIGINK
jgi:hypothetical protein